MGPHIQAAHSICWIREVTLLGSKVACNPAATEGGAGYMHALMQAF
jgi:hypothetical protein